MAWTILSGLGWITYRTELELSPTVLSDAQKDQWFYKEKVFDPILLTTPFDADEDAFVLSNGTDYSLAA